MTIVSSSTMGGAPAAMVSMRVWQAALRLFQARTALSEGGDILFLLYALVKSDSGCNFAASIAAWKLMAIGVGSGISASPCTE